MLVVGKSHHTPQTQQRLFFSLCLINSSSFAFANNWVRPLSSELPSKVGMLFSACGGCNAAVKKWLRITGWDHVHSKDHRKRNWRNKKFEMRIQIWIFQRTKNGYLTVIRIVRIRYAWWNGSEHSFGIVESYRSRRYAWIVLQRNTHGEPVRNVHILFSHSGGVCTLIWLSTQVECRSVR